MSGMEIDQRRRQRMISNRESARRARMKKKQHLGDLVDEVARLSDENGRISEQVKVRSEGCANLEAENGVLRAHVTELMDRLRSVNSLLRMVEVASGTAMEIPEIPDPLLKPWQLPCPARPLMASSNVFK